MPLVVHLCTLRFAWLQVTELYRRRIPPDSVVLDLMSSWVSHLPEEVRYRRVIGHGMNAQEVRGCFSSAGSVAIDTAGCNARGPAALAWAIASAVTLATTVGCFCSRLRMSG